VWLFKTKSCGFVRMQDADAKQLEDEMNGGAHSGIMILGTGNKYQIDFSNMTQTNLSTNVKRKLRREAVTAVSCPAPAAAMPTVPVPSVVAVSDQVKEILAYGQHGTTKPKRSFAARFPFASLYRLHKLHHNTAPDFMKKMSEEEIFNYFGDQTKRIERAMRHVDKSIACALQAARDMDTGTGGTDCAEAMFVYLEQLCFSKARNRLRESRRLSSWRNPRGLK
jgi:hypothetical protein